ncbi:MAG: hypothetical protein Fur0043_09780 [Anaerolineales bacterium]
MNHLVTISDLIVERERKIVLRVERLSIAPGETLAVVGPNGAGKSTLLLVLARLLKPSQGEILFQGQPISAQSDTAYRRRIGLVMQDPLLFDTSVFENVASGLRFRGLDRGEIQRRVRLWLGRLGVEDLSKRRASQLSGGEAQRVSLARALALEPQLLLLDEPFAALDPPTRSRLLDDLETLLQETATTTVFVTHDLDEAVQVAGRMAVMVGNRLRQIGNPEEVFAAPADTEVAQFLSHRSKGISQELACGGVNLLR